MKQSIITKIRSLLVETSSDISQSLRLWRYLLYRSWLNHKLNYQNSRLGLLWPILSLFIFVVILGSVWGIILGKQDTGAYFVYLLVGFPVWQFISGAVERGNQGIDPSFASSGLPLSAVLFERVSAVGLTYLNVLPVVLIAVVFISGFSDINLPLFVVSLLFLVMWGVGAVLITTVLATIYPDTRHLVTALMRMSFLATPIIWEASRLNEYQQYLWLNPFYAPLGFVRSTLTGAESASDFIVFAPLYSTAVLALGLIMFARYFNIVRQRA